MLYPANVHGSWQYKHIVIRRPHRAAKSQKQNCYMWEYGAVGVGDEGCTSRIEIRLRSYIPPSDALSALAAAAAQDFLIVAIDKSAFDSQKIRSRDKIQDARKADFVNWLMQISMSQNQAFAPTVPRSQIGLGMCRERKAGLRS